jgi:hypothetical protein
MQLTRTDIQYFVIKTIENFATPPYPMVSIADDLQGPELRLQTYDINRLASALTHYIAANQTPKPGAFLGTDFNDVTTDVQYVIDIVCARVGIA